MSHDHHPSAPASPDDAYYSAYRGSVNAPDGSFDHFLRIVYPIHEQKGYWRFHSIEDERRAFVLGLSTPEMVLLAVDRGDGPFDEIVLRWLPGSLDKGNKPSIGTAAAHLQSICNERRILGRPLSFLGRVPTYPIITDSTDPILLNFRLVKYGLEKGDPHVVGIVKTHQQHTRPQDGVVMSIEEQNGSTGQQTRSGASRGISAVADTDQDLSMPLDPDLFDSPTARLGPQQLSFPYTNQHRTCSEASRTSTRTSIQSSPGVELAPFEDVIMIAESPEQEQEFVEFSKMNNQLPCIDCDQVGSHSWDCNIGSRSISALTRPNLTQNRHQATQTPHTF